MPVDRTIILENVTFKYSGAGNEPIFKNFNLKFPAGKTTAIVGMSGSGKTTLLKLLMRFYQCCKGNIYIGETNLNQIGQFTWRESCGVILQDSHIFAGSILGNIAVGVEIPDQAKVMEAIRISNLGDIIQKLPFGLETMIGTGGKGLSQGQKQRLLIARAVYKDPEYIFLDEATNSLDANNEKEIMENLNLFFRKRTVIIVAHRLSTVKNADSIIVLEKGKVVEQGNHSELTSFKGKYFELVKNQLELGE